jgi:hypothetical protein
MKRKALDYLTTGIVWAFRLMPAAALFSAFFALEGGLRWIGLLGFLPLALVLAGAPGCACAARHGKTPAVPTWPSF